MKGNRRGVRRASAALGRALALVALMGVALVVVVVVLVVVAIGLEAVL